MRTAPIALCVAIAVATIIIGAWFANIPIAPIGFITFPLSAGIVLFLLFGFAITRRWLPKPLLAAAAATGAGAAVLLAVEWVGGSPHTLAHWRVIATDSQTAWIVAFFIGTALAALWAAVRATSIAPSN